LARSGSSPLGLAVATVADDPTRMAAVVEAMEQAQGGPGVGRADRGRKGSFLTWRPFAKVYGTFVDQDTTTEQTGFSSNGVGMITGVDTDVNEWLTAGVMFGYNHDEIDYDLSRGEADVDSLRFGPYASASFGDLFVDASLTFGYHWNEVDRKVTVGAFRETAKSDYDAWDLTLYGGVGYDIDLEGWIVTPTASLQWTHYDQESFRESGAGAANLDVDSWQSDTIRQVLGVKLRKMFHCDGLRIVPEAYLGWAHEYIDQDNVTANFVGQNTPFSFSVDTGDSDALIFGAGTSVLLNETTSVYVRWDGQCGSETTANNVAVGMSFSF
jgi:outer membrane autotransporter protein